MRTVTTLTGLLDLVSLIERDHRVQIVYTYDTKNPAVFNAGVREFLESLDAPVIPWDQAVEAGFDLVLAASENDQLERFRAPVVLISHGIGHQKYYPDSRIIAGMNPQRLVVDGQVVPSVIMLSHHEQREQLRTVCPQAVDRAVVVGDPCLDRLLLSRHRMAGYRAALGARERILVVLASTWGADSLFGGSPELAERLLAELDADLFTVALIVHPGVWSAHGPRQVKAWLDRAIKAGLAIIPFREAWRGALVAAHVVVSDFGSLSLYAAALDKPLLLMPGLAKTTVDGSPIAALASRTARLDPGKPLAAQILTARAHHVSGMHEPAVKQAVEHPGHAAGPARKLLYRLMNLTEPATEAEFDPVPAPGSERSPVGAYIVGGRVLAEGVEVRRFPAVLDVDGLGYRHIAADLRHATIRELGGASILYLHAEDSPEAALRNWPRAELTAQVRGDSCVIHGRDFVVTLSADRIDPRVLASLVHIRLARGENPAGPLLLGDRVIPVHAGSGMPSDG